jgi:putative spermidine/putrescine transport system substrate-binding protein
MDEKRTAFSRRTFLKGAAQGAALGLGMIAGHGPALGEHGGGVDDTSELVVGVWGGAFPKIIKKTVIPDLEARYRCKVYVKEGTGGDRMAILRANPRIPALDVVYLADGEPIPLIQEGILEAPAAQVIPEFADLYPVAQISGYGIALSDVGLAYNPQKVKEPPTSWLDLWNPAYKGHVVIPSMKTTQGSSFVPTLAKILTGDQKNIEVAKRKLLELKPNVLAYHRGTSHALTMLEQGDAWISVTIGGYVYQARDRGQSVDFVRPKEGAFSLINFINIASHTRHHTLAREYVRLTLQAKSQRAFAEDMYFGPSNRKIQLSGKVAKLAVYGQEQVDRLINLDWMFIEAQRPAWIEWWNQNMA